MQRDWTKPLTGEEAKGITLNELMDHPDKMVREMAFRIEFELNVQQLAEKRTMPRKCPSK